MSGENYLTAEARARVEIDRQLVACGWSVQDRKDMNLYAAQGVAVREFHAERLSVRACSIWFRAHPAALRRLREDGRLVAGGVSAAPSVGADVVAHDVTEGYVRGAEVDPLVDEYGLEPSSVDQGNVRLRVIGELWPFGEHERVAPAVVVALDLLDDTDARTRRAGQSLLRRALRKPGATQSPGTSTLGAAERSTDVG